MDTKYMHPDINRFKQYLLRRDDLLDISQEEDLPEFGPYVDYSTSPQYADNFSTFVISDISVTVHNFFNYNQMLPLYKVFPLHEIIEMLLSTSIEEDTPGTMEYIASLTEEKLNDFIYEVDIDNLFLFYEHLTTSLDKEISSKVPEYKQSAKYVFFRWLDPVSVCLCNDHELKKLALPHNFTPAERTITRKHL